MSQENPISKQPLIRLVRMMTVVFWIQSKGRSLLLTLLQKSPVTSHTHSPEQVQNQQDDQDQPDNPYASARPPSPISVIAAAAPEQEHEDNDQ